MAGMRVAFVISGSRGDFQPYLAVAVGLRAAGHAVKMYTSRDHCKMAADLGYEASVICKEIEDFVRSPDCKRAMELGDFGAVAWKVFDQTLLEEEREVFNKRIEDDIRDFNPTLIAFNYLGIVHLQQALNSAVPDVPRINMELQPQCLASNEFRCVSFHRELPDEDTPPVMTFLWGLGLSEYQVETYQKAFADKQSKEEVFKLMNQVDTPEMTFEHSFEPDKWVLPRFFAYSPSFFPNSADWSTSENLKVVGRLQLSKDFQDEQVKRGSKYFSVGSEYGQCLEFIAKVGPPVYIGWGSMFVYSKEHMTLLAVEAVKRAGEKAIILSGWAQLGLDGLEGAPNEEELRDYCKDNILFIKAAPHELLLPQCKLAVHHGGIGTLQASLAAACPTIVTPCFSDQFDNGKALTKLGCGAATTKLGLLKADELGDAIRKACSDASCKAKVQAVADAMAKEDGVGVMVAWMEKFHTEDLASGRYKENLLAYKERLYGLREKGKKLSLAQLLAKFQSLLYSRYPALKEWQMRNMKFMAEASDLSKKGCLWWTQGTSVLARSGEGLKTAEVGRFQRYAFVEELERKGTRIHVRRLKGKGPEKGWVTSTVKGKDMVAKITDATEIGRIVQMQFDELFADLAPSAKEED